MNIQDKMQEIHHKYGVTEKANYEIQLFVETLLKEQKEQLSLCGVGISAYLMDIDNEATIVVANNISDALDKAHNVAEKDYEMTYSKSLPVLH
jgi:hypothetical protein